MRNTIEILLAVFTMTVIHACSTNTERGTSQGTDSGNYDTGGEGESDSDADSDSDSDTSDSSSTDTESDSESQESEGESEEESTSTTEGEEEDESVDVLDTENGNDVQDQGSITGFTTMVDNYMLIILPVASMGGALIYGLVRRNGNSYKPSSRTSRPANRSNRQKKAVSRTAKEKNKSKRSRKSSGKSEKKKGTELMLNL